MKMDPRYLTLRPEQKVSSRAIRHAERLANDLNGVITVLTIQRDGFTEYDFGCAYVDSQGAIYNALPKTYWSDSMREYRRGMPSYKLVKHSA